MNKNREWIVSALALALVLVTTLYLKIPTQWGYFNLGDAMIFLFASILPPGLSFLMAGVGSALADLLGNYGQYAPFTLVVKGCEGYLVAWGIMHLKKETLAYILGIIILVVGYTAVDWLLYGSLITALGGVAYNVVQGVCGLIVSLLLVTRIRKIYEKIK
ncbi:MAG: ECF transporter S component [Anaerorhabdus sp.]